MCVKGTYALAVELRDLRARNREPEKALGQVFVRQNREEEFLNEFLFKQ